MEIKKDCKMSYTVEDVKAMKGVCAELINGELVIKQGTTITHNKIVRNLYRQLENYISKHNGKCEVFTENVDLFCYEMADECSQEYYEPDVMVVCNRDESLDDGIHVPPLFVAEVTSPSTKRFDYSAKLKTYMTIGVEEYWVIDIEKSAVIKYVKANDYAPEIMKDMNQLEVSVYAGLNISLI